MAEYLISERALEGAALEQLRTALLASPLVGKSTLAGSFRDSYGFAVTFTDAGKAELVSRFSPLEAALSALVPPARLCPAAPNAWYLNLLQLPKGRGVGRHTDGTLRRPADEPQLLPAVVSVLYLLAPGEGGELELFDGPRQVARITPQSGSVVHFAGALEHAVAPSDSDRISLVLEQYALPADVLARLPAFKLDSRAGFAAHLADHAARPPRKLDFE